MVFCLGLSRPSAGQRNAGGQVLTALLEADLGMLPGVYPKVPA